MKDEAEDEFGEGNAGVPMDHLYFMRPLKGKSGKQVMQAIQEIILELRRENLPVVRIHSDRAHELRSVGLREWTLNNGILLTRTEGQSPQSNGTAKRAVRYLKGQARKLLRTSGLSTAHWAPAMTINESNVYRDLPTAMPLWNSGGHQEEPPTRRRLKGKTPVDDGVAPKAIKSGGDARRLLEQELLNIIRESKEFDLVKRPQLKLQGELQEDAGYVTVGAYQHGGIVGVTNFTKDNPTFAARAAELMAMVFPDEVFTSITVVKANPSGYLQRQIDLQLDRATAGWPELRNLGRASTRRSLPREVPGKDPQGSSASGSSSQPEVRSKNKA